MVVKTVVAGAVAFGLVLGLTACVHTNIGGDEVLRSETETSFPEAPRPSETQDAVAPDLDGYPAEADANRDGKLSEFEKQLWEQNRPRDFAMPDGSTVTINPKEPLPEPVREVLVERAQPGGDQTRHNANDDPDVVSGLIQNVQQTANDQAQQTGKRIVIVFANNTGRGVEWLAAPSGIKNTGIPGTANKEAMVSAVRSWANTKGYEVVVLN